MLCRQPCLRRGLSCLSAGRSVWARRRRSRWRRLTGHTAGAGESVLRVAVGAVSGLRPDHAALGWALCPASGTAPCHRQSSITGLGPTPPQGTSPPAGSSSRPSVAARVAKRRWRLFGMRCTNWPLTVNGLWWLRDPPVPLRGEVLAERPALALLVTDLSGRQLATRSAAR